MPVFYCCVCERMFHVISVHLDFDAGRHTCQRNTQVPEFTIYAIWSNKTFHTSPVTWTALQSVRRFTWISVSSDFQFIWFFGILLLFCSLTKSKNSYFWTVSRQCFKPSNVKRIPCITHFSLKTLNLNSGSQFCFIWTLWFTSCFCTVFKENEVNSVLSS